MATALLGVALVALNPPTGRSQTPGADPVLGTVTLTPGFTPDPHGWDVRLGASEEPVDVASLHLVDGTSGVPCGRFYVDEPPTLRLVLGDSATGHGLGFLRIFIDVGPTSGSDPALLVRAPDGSWRCQDDGRVPEYSGMMPVVDLNAPEAGAYEVWAGSYSRAIGEPATLTVTADRSHHPEQGGQGWTAGRREGSGEGSGSGEGLGQGDGSGW